MVVVGVGVGFRVGVGVGVGVGFRVGVGVGFGVGSWVEYCIILFIKPYYIIKYVSIVEGLFRGREGCSEQFGTVVRRFVVLNVRTTKAA